MTGVPRGPHGGPEFPGDGPKKRAAIKPPTNVGPMCQCGHGMYEHYMCGAADEMRCYRRLGCGCQQFKPV